MEPPHLCQTFFLTAFERVEHAHSRKVPTDEVQDGLQAWSSLPQGQGVNWASRSRLPKAAYPHGLLQVSAALQGFATRGSCLSSPSAFLPEGDMQLAYGNLVDEPDKAGPSERPTIVAKEAHGLRKGPPRSRVGRVAPVVNSKGCCVLRVGEVLEELPHCLGPQHPLQQTGT